MSEIVRTNFLGVTFKAGDRIRIIHDCSGTLRGQEYRLLQNKVGMLIAAHSLDDGSGCTCIDNWKLLTDEWDT
jgi:hypothetical protein